MEFEDRITTANALNEELELEVSLRPKRFSEYIGQKNVTDNLKVYIEAARMRKEPLDHVLFYGPPGLGKTTLAGIIANELHVDLRITSGPAIERAGDLAAILTNLSDHDVLFIDEIHRLNRTVEEVLYAAMEDYALDIIIGKGPSARSIRLDLAKFTLIGATTRAGSLSAPLRDRFGVISKFEMYRPEELRQILRRSAEILRVGIDEESLTEIARRSRGTPRVANRLLKRVRDFSQVMGTGVVDLEITNKTLLALGIDKEGLESLDREILSIIIQRFRGGPVGIDTIAAAIGEERVTIEDVYEPYLIQAGFLHRTQKGRMVSELAYHHLGLSTPQEGQMSFPSKEN
ncbi:MAG: Holliday junction branch migration DNA helicase RuvB [Firmicutes bacterium HGW-Firmicutes-11]|jgi:Holliday junction DNA helicase RuvB|nr:MAG: Holliday junction branch migration DNA helicase RuvB [Firmicutes bacterium HGW-Firmicutes-11]